MQRKKWNHRLKMILESDLKASDKEKVIGLVQNPQIGEAKHPWNGAGQAELASSKDGWISKAAA